MVFMHDVIVIGYGPAGCTAAVFSIRRNLKTLVLSDPFSLSQLEEATVVDDWPGELGIRGIDLVAKFREHSKKLGVEMKEDKVTDLKKSGKRFIVRAEKGRYEGKTVIFATGAKHRKGLVKGEDRFAYFQQ